MSTPPDRYVVIGQPVDHSRSPAIHTLFATATSQNMAYERLAAPTDDFAGTAADFFNQGGRGANVTLPFKLEAAAFADELSERATAAGAVNTLSKADDGRIHGDNTDGVGLARDLEKRADAQLAGARVLILGAGGAVRGALPALLAQEPYGITIANRTTTRAEAVAAAVDNAVATAAPAELTETYDIVINAVSAGLDGTMPAVPDIIIGHHSIAYDMLYADTPTPFVQWARDRGARRVTDGFGMLVEQAAESFYCWRGRRPDTMPVIEKLGYGNSG
ncbi:shikimate dehydrogenase [Salinisphaera sp. USBA-960]|uniref:shikimate dehydrogenase n=1 Tax=Salinisphaera orenii TaxID=856731 RepID=UPI000DBE8D39|nr:shikimate dehydrogenase [Salifodinibacter halophilus]NNC25962.1 shikimate dehydrogenase [Salifodinibacter halophilus]